MKGAMGTGDCGDTDILGGRRVRKDSAVVEALGAVDEAASAIGLARSLVESEARKTILRCYQNAMQAIAAEVANAGKGRATRHDFAGDIKAIEEHIRLTEMVVGRPQGFLTPGETPAEAALDVARALVRRAERRVVTLEEEGQTVDASICAYLNRLSDLLFSMVCAETVGK